MLPHVLPHPPHIDIPKYIPDYNNNLVVARPRLASSSSFFAGIAHLVSSRVSPAHSDSPSDTVDDDHISSPHSPPGSSGNYHYDNRGFNSPISPSEMYASNTSYSTSSPSYQNAQNNYNINSATALRESDPVGSYPSDSPSPVDVHSSSSFPHPLSAPHTQERFPHSSYYTAADRFNPPPESLPDRYARHAHSDKYSGGGNSHPQNTLLDNRRMSEPAILGGVSQYATPPNDPTAASRYEQFHFTFGPHARPTPPAYSSSLQRGASIDSLRDLRQQHYEYPPSHTQAEHTAWKQDEESGSGLDQPHSPLQPTFSGGVLASPTTGLPYSPIAEYGPSPPGTGTSTSSNPPLGINLTRGPLPSAHVSQAIANVIHSPIDSTNSKTYSFVALPGNAVKKRPRRRYDEIERLYQCSWPDCAKAYGTLNHLNAHVTMQKHGQKRSPNEFKELRKQWRKAKKEAESSVGPTRRGSLSMRHDDHDLYDAHRYGSHLQSHQSQHPRQHSHHGLGLPASVSIPHAGSDERYAVPVDDIRYPVDDRDDHAADYANMGVRHRYGGTAPASWHPSLTSSSRSSIHYPYGMSSSLPTHSHAHHGHLNLQPPSHSPPQPHAPSPTNAAMNRLPPDSTLLTPLPGYQAPSLLPPLHTGSDLAYPSDGYEMYDEERPGTGHGSLGQGSGDEYDH